MGILNVTPDSFSDGGKFDRFTGFQDKEMIRVAAETGAGIVVMHMQGTPRTMQQNPTYGDVVSEVRSFFETRHRELIDAGIDAECIAYDPGIGFGKNLEHNLALLKNLEALEVEGRPVLLGVSGNPSSGKLSVQKKSKTAAGRPSRLLRMRENRESGFTGSMR